MFSSLEQPQSESEHSAIGTPRLALRVTNLSKCYQIYDRPEDRLKQSIFPKVQRLIGQAPQQYHHDFWALRDVSLDIRRGETVGIVGRNGSGKSTLLQLICGTLSPTSGTIETHGRIAALLELGSGFNPEFTGRENVYMNATVLGLGRDEINSRFEQITAFADIGQFLDQPLRKYSSGMIVRLAFAVSVCIDPDILVVDEALSVGDEAFQRKCFARIEQIQERGGTILFVSHAAQTVVQLCNRAILIDAGEKIAEGQPKSVVSQYQRLVHAPTDRAARIRSAIRTGIELTEGERSNRWPQNQDNSNFEKPRSLSAGAFLADDVRSESTVTYEPDGAEISDVHITTLDGKRVNHLVHGDAYVLRYTVKFSEAAEKVNFASLLKTSSGVEIAGQFADPGAAGISVETGQSLTVEFYFDALFLPGTYFCNAGVFTQQGGNFRQLHRAIDALMFRVLPSDSLSTVFGIINLQHEPARVRFGTCK